MVGRRECMVGSREWWAVGSGGQKGVLGSREWWAVGSGGHAVGSGGQ